MLLAEAEWQINPSTAAEHLAPLAAEAMSGRLEHADQLTVVNRLLWHGRTSEARELIERAREEMRTHHVNLPDRDLAYLKEGTKGFDEYVQAVEWAQGYAAANRRACGSSPPSRPTDSASNRTCSSSDRAARSRPPLTVSR